MPAQAGIQRREGGWIPACAGMTEQRVVIDAQIIAARVFSKEDTKSTKVGAMIIRTLRVLRAFVVKSTFHMVGHLPKCIAKLPATTLTMPTITFQLIASTSRRNNAAKISDQTG